MRLLLFNYCGSSVLPEPCAFKLCLFVCIFRAAPPPLGSQLPQVSIFLSAALRPEGDALSLMSSTVSLLLPSPVSVYFP